MCDLPANAALQNERLGYTNALGIPELRSRIARHYRDYYGVRVPAERIAVTTGSSGAFLLSFLASMDAGSRIAQRIGGGVLVVSQFTLAADTTKGNRPGFSRAAPPELAERLIEQFVEALRSRHPSVATGVFGADMQVALVNDGPVTFNLRVPPTG